jgi:N-acyl-D-amino-acid deacylase
MVDILFRNGEVIDGSGAKARKADVAVEGNKIVMVGDLSNIQADEVIDVTGKVVSPGFIDMHSHADMTISVINEADSLVHQGITTIVSGQCGSSPVPLLDETRDEVIGSEREFPIPWERFSTFGSFLDYLEEKGMSVNMHPLVGQGAIRSAVMGFSAKRPSEEQMDRMQGLVRQALDEGAAGLSTGLIYPPGSYASTEELIEITRPVGERGGIYFSHIRGEGDTLLEATREEIEIGRKTGAAIHHSHYKAAGRDNWDLAEKGLALIDAARAEGLDMTADMYPYLAGGTSLVAILPEWAQEGGLPAITERLQDPATRRKMEESMKTVGFFKVAEWDKVLIPSSANPAHEGKYIAELAQAEDKSPYDWIFDAILETKGEVGMILFMMSEENVRKQLVHPAMMVGTDGAGMPFEGPFAKGAPHPRSFGTFPRVLGKYVREEKVLTLEDAVRRMTSFPAQKLSLADRGLVKKGYKADLVIFDPQTILDKADFVNPFQKPVGIEHVLVNGQFVVRSGMHTHALPGVVTTR